MDLGINYILDNDKIILIFNDNDKLIFKNNNGIIEKSLLHNTENNINQIHNLINKDETSYNSEGPKNEQISNINSLEKNNGKQTKEIVKENKIYLKYEKEFDIIVSLIYNNYLIKEEIDKSKNKDNNNNDYINKLSCYFINNNFLNGFKDLFSYGKFCDYIINKNYTKQDIKEKKNIIIKEVCESLNNTCNFENIENKKKELFKYQNDSKSNIIQIPNSKNYISFPNNFFIINKEIYENFKLCKYINELEEQKIIINNGKIIFKYEYNSNNCIKYYNIILSQYNIHNNLIIPEIIFEFKEKENERNTFFNIFLKTTNTNYNLDIKESNIDLNGKIVGQLYKINPNNNKEILFENDSNSNILNY